MAQQDMPEIQLMTILCLVESKDLQKDTSLDLVLHTTMNTMQNMIASDKILQYTGAIWLYVYIFLFQRD